MPSIDFKRVRAKVTEFWSGEPISDASLVQRAAEHARSPGFPPYPNVRAIDPAQGLWDLYLPAELVQGLDEQQEREFEFEAEDRYFRVSLLHR